MARPLPAAPALEARRRREPPRLRLTRITARYWFRQLFTLVGIVVTLAYLASLGLSLTLLGTIDVQPLWLAVTGIFMAERVVTVRCDWSILRHRPFEKLVLTACHPLHSASHRYAVFARLETTTRPAGEAPTA